VVLTSSWLLAACGSATPIESAGSLESTSSMPEPTSSPTVSLDSSPTVFGSRTAPSEQEVDESVVLMVSGTVSSDPLSVDFSPTRLLPTTKQLEVKPGPWVLTLETDDGSIDVPFDVIEQLDGDELAARFSIAVQPAPVGPIRRIAVAFEGGEVGSADGGDSVPSIRITEPVPDATISIDEFEIAWESAVGTSAAAYLSVDGGTSWTSIITQAESSPIRPAPGIAVPSDEALVLLTVSDGVNATFARVGPLTLTASS